MLNKIRWLDNIGRHTRSSRNEKLENFLTDLQRLTIVHESDGNGASFYRFADGTRSRDEREENEQAVGKGKDDKKKEKEKASGQDQDNDKDKDKEKTKEPKSSMSRRGSQDRLGGEAKQVSFSKEYDGQDQKQKQEKDQAKGQSDDPLEGDKEMMDQHGQGAEAEQDKDRDRDRDRDRRFDRSAGRTDSRGPSGATTPAQQAGRPGPGEQTKVQVSTKGDSDTSYDRNRNQSSRPTYPHELGAVSQAPEATVQGTTDPAKDAGAETETDSSGARVD